MKLGLGSTGFGVGAIAGAPLWLRGKVCSQQASFLIRRLQTPARCTYQGLLAPLQPHHKLLWCHPAYPLHLRDFLQTKENNARFDGPGWTTMQTKLRGRGVAVWNRDMHVSATGSLGTDLGAGSSRIPNPALTLTHGPSPLSCSCPAVKGGL